MNQPFAPSYPRLQPVTGFTSDDFLQMVEVGAFADMRAELVAGVLEKMSPAYMDHGRRNAEVIVKLAEAYRATDFQLGTDVIIRIDGATVRAADVVVGLASLAGHQAATGPDLVLAVEISDTTLGRDLGEKILDYARAGVAEYWVVDVKAKVIHAMRNPKIDEYADGEIVRFGEPIRVPGANASITLG